MSGRADFKKLRKNSVQLFTTDARMVISSGYNEQEGTRKFVGKGLAGFIQKPYRLTSLQQVIQNILGGFDENG